MCKDCWQGKASNPHSMRCVCYFGDDCCYHNEWSIGRRTRGFHEEVRLG
jgi:hypothetical protein